MEKLDTSTEDGVNRHVREIEFNQYVRDTPLYKVMQTEHGRQFVWELLEEGSIFNDPMHIDSFAATAYTLGMQAIARNLFAKLNENELLVLYRMMQNEAHIRAKESKSENRIDGDDL